MSLDFTGTDVLPYHIRNKLFFTENCFVKQDTHVCSSVIFYFFFNISACKAADSVQQRTHTFRVFCVIWSFPANHRCLCSRQPFCLFSLKHCSFHRLVTDPAPSPPHCPREHHFCNASLTHVINPPPAPPPSLPTPTPAT